MIDVNIKFVVGMTGTNKYLVTIINSNHVSSYLKKNVQKLFNH